MLGSSDYMASEYNQRSAVSYAYVHLRFRRTTWSTRNEKIGRAEAAYAHCQTCASTV